MNVGEALKANISNKKSALFEKFPSPRTGFSLNEVHRMSAELGLKLQLAKREPGAAVIVPAVAHWNVEHYGAIVREVNGYYLLKDPTFGNETWMTSQAIDRESSGYFLVPTGPLPTGWTRATTADGAKLFGKGYVPNLCPDCTDGPIPTPPCPAPSGPPLAMATYGLQLFSAGLHIEDTPVGYSASAGPDVRVQIAYNQREASQPATMDFTNFGPQFVSNWISYLVDNPSNSAADISLRKRSGGGETHTNYNSTTQTFGAERKTGAVLSRLTANTYKKVYPDGSQEYYEQYIGTSGTQRNVFLSRVVDAHGREVDIEYDSSYPARISSIVDASGLATVFHYDYPSEPYLVTTIEDPYGREATFSYASIASKVRLQSTEDPFGIISSFEYSVDGEIVAMTTPYGTTKFSLSPPYVDLNGLFRFVEATDPLGQKERVEYNISPATGIPSTFESPQPSTTIVQFTNNYNNWRNTFYWDKLAMKLAPGNYQKAYRYHWLHADADSATNILESEVPPLESRIYYNYPGQSNQYVVQGTSAKPSVVARVVKNAAGNDQTQATKYEYNAQGNITKTTDPLGREVLTEYATNGVDVTAIKRRTGTSGGLPVWTTTATFSYAGSPPPHQPSSMTDGAGQTTSYTYTASGQIATVTNAKSEVTTYTYETNTASAAYDRVLSITGDVPGGNRTFTYDSYGRLRTSTDSEGYVLTYDYDSLDRVRTTTYPDGSYEQFEYDDHSLVATRDREGRWTRHMYNPLQQRVLTQDPAMRQTQFEWCRCGQLRRFVDGNGNITEWQRDERSRVTKQIFANASFNSYTYDLSGRLKTEVDPMSRTTTYTYNVDDRIAKKDYSDTATPDVTYTYDTWYPRLITRLDGTGTTSFTYHADGASTLGAGRVAKINGPLTDDTLKHTYDEVGRLKKLEIVDDSTATTATYSEEYTFDARARVTGVQNNLGTSTYAFVGQSGRPSSATYANGMQVLYDYFGATSDFLLKQIKNLSSATPPAVISQFDYTYRQDRSIDTWTIDQGSGASTWTFGYDGAKELVSAKRENGTTLLESNYYGYDKAGNRIQVGAADAGARNYDVNNLNQLTTERDNGRTTFSGTINEPATVTVNGQAARVTSTDGGAPFRFDALLNLDAGTSTVVVQAKDGQNNTATKTYSVSTAGSSKTFEYDANGNLRYEKQPNGTVTREYRWDQQNRLVRVLEGTHESVYEYDGESHRTRIKELISSVETKNETFVWCGSRICQKRVANGSTVVRNYFEQGFEEGTSDYFYTWDRLGSLREVVASDGTTIASRVSYDPWGKATESGAGALPDFGFTGHYFDRPTGLNLTWYRAYDPALGRWLSNDPIGLLGGANLYDYVSNDPVNSTDPDGTDECEDKCYAEYRPHHLRCLAECNNDPGSACYLDCESPYWDTYIACRNKCRKPPPPKPPPPPRPASCQ
jgi:RHS repeat-associated protein